MLDFEMEDLLPVVAELTKKFTGGDSTSVTYERANQFMEAVLYCLGETEKENILLPADGNSVLSAKQVYDAGYEKVIEKVRKAQEKYNSMIEDFKDYDNRNYRDTVRKALPGFFQYYDARFAPQNSIITMDYPVLKPLQEYSGIDAVEQYIACIFLEQQFMGAFPEEYVKDVLQRFDGGYRSQFYNLCRILFRHVMGCALIRKKPGGIPEPKEYEKLAEIIRHYAGEEMKSLLVSLTDRLVEEREEWFGEVGSYLKRDIEDFVAELCLGAKYGNLHKMVVL